MDHDQGGSTSYSAGMVRNVRARFVDHWIMDITIPKGDRDDDLDLHPFSRLTEAEFKDMIAMGEHFVVYCYTLSAFIYTTTRPTKVHATRKFQGAFLRGLPYTMLTVLFGWWHPLGIVNSLNSIIANTRGGADVSPQIIEYIRQQDPRYLYGMS